MGGIKDFITYIKDYKQQLDNNRESNIKYINWWAQGADASKYWSTRFIRNRNILRADDKKTLTFYSVLGKPLSMKLGINTSKVFWTGENIHRDERGFRFSKYEDYGLKSGIDLGIGFDYIEKEKYLRFPLWILYFVDPGATTKADLDALCHKISYPKHESRANKFCSMVSSHDPNGIRKEIFEKLKDIDFVASGGKYLNNTDELQTTYKDDKWTFLKHHKFNICPENSNAKGYVTEKIFEAINAGTIPIYWGSDNNPEPEVINKDAVLFWEEGKDNAKLIRQVQELYENEKLYKEFVSQPRLLPTAAEYIEHRLNELEARLRAVLQ